MVVYFVPYHSFPSISLLPFLKSLEEASSATLELLFSLPLMCALMPIHPATIVSSGRIINSIGHPMVSDRDAHIPTRGSHKIVLKERHVLCAFTSLFLNDVAAQICELN